MLCMLGLAVIISLSCGSVIDRLWCVCALDRFVPPPPPPEAENIALDKALSLLTNRVSIDSALAAWPPVLRPFGDPFIRRC